MAHNAQACFMDAAEQFTEVAEENCTDSWFDESANNKCKMKWLVLPLLPEQ